MLWSGLMAEPDRVIAPWDELLDVARTAPSPHNVQPWRIRVVSDVEAELWIEKRRTLPQEDVTGSFIILTMGMFVETLRIVAAHHGFALDDTPIHEPTWYAAEHLESLPDACFPFATLRLRADPGTHPAFALDLLARRRTSRLHYRDEPLKAEAARRLDDLSQGFGHRYVQTHDVARIERLLALNIEAVFEDLNHPPYHDELADWIRYLPSQSKLHRDGLDARCMNVSPVELWLPFRWPALLRWPLLRPWFARRYRRQIGPVATMGALCGPFWDPKDAYRGGAFLIHFWLEVTRLGYFLHPYGNLVTNRPTAARVEAETGWSNVWLAFKIGRSDTPPASRRRSLEEVIF